jgi:hypothetical protein
VGKRQWACVATAFGGARLPNVDNRFAEPLAFPTDVMCCVVALADLSDVALRVSQPIVAEIAKSGRGPACAICAKCRNA